MKAGRVLGGGFARGAAQYGFLQGFLKTLKDVDINLISCSSIGVVNALALSYGIMDDIKDFYVESDFKSLKILREALKKHYFHEMIDQITSSGSPKIRTYITASCLNDLSAHYYLIEESTPTEQIKKLSDITCTFPFVNGVIKKFEGKIYFDGGAFDNVPLYPMQYEEDLDIIFVFHCTRNYEPPANIIKSDVPILDINITSLMPQKMETFSFQKENLSLMVEAGYQGGVEIAQKLQKELDEGKPLKEACQNVINDNLKHGNKYDNHLMSSVEILNRAILSKYN